MHIITPRRLREFVAIHATAQPGLATWERIATAATWSNLVETRADWPTADQVGRVTVFNIGGNEYRLITYIDYRHHKVFMAGCAFQGWKPNALALGGMPVHHPHADTRPLGNSPGHRAYLLFE